MTLRKTIFWTHLIVGVAAGLVILSMCVTGTMMAYEKQIVDFAERNVSKVEVPADAEKLSPEALVAKASESTQEPFAGITLRSDPQEAAMLNFGKDTLLFVDPYSGKVLGEASKARTYLKKIEFWHRWLGNKELFKPVTGAAAIAFFLLGLSGLYLWWGNWIKNSFKRVAAFNFQMTGRARDWNWHNVIGFWALPFLLISTSTGIIMSYQWAGNLLYKAPQAQGGEKKKPSEEKKDLGGEQKRAPQMAGLNLFFDAAQAHAPHWRTISMRLPQKDSGSVIMGIEESQSFHPYPRSSLTLDRETAAVIKWEAYDDIKGGRKARMWIKPIHTGEAGGLLGQTLAFIVSFGGSVLVYTGFALAWRRFRNRKSRALANRSSGVKLPKPLPDLELSR